MSDTIKSIYGKQYDYTGLANIPDIVEIDDTLSIEGKAADAKAVGDAISGLSGGTFSGNASDVTYDNTESGMEATTVQAAIDELKAGQDSGGNVDQAQIEQAVADYMAEHPVSGGGMSSTASALLINILRNAMYTADQSANITALENALFNGGTAPDVPVDPDIPDEPDAPVVTKYTIVSALLHATSNNASASVESGASYTATITAEDGYTLDGATVSVSMGGVDITATAYANGVVTIGSVTGNVIITVNAVSIAVSETLYELPEATTFDGTNTIDTGVALLANDTAWTITGEVENLADGVTLTIFRLEEQSYNDYRFHLYSNSSIKMRWSNKEAKCSNIIWLAQKAGNAAKFVLTHEAGTSTIKYSGYHTNIAGKTEKYDAELVRENYVALDGSLTIGIEGNFRMDAFGIYSRVYTADEITAYLGA